MTRLTGRGRPERVFYAVYLGAILLIILCGFAPSFFLRGIINTASPVPHLRPDMVVHGLAATAFVAFVPLQVWLIATGRIGLHMRMGNWGFALGAAFMLSAYYSSAVTFRNPLPEVQLPPSGLASLTLFALAGFATLLGLAWRKRRDGQAHKRLIVGALCHVMGPALIRIPIWPPPPAGLAIAELALLGFFVPMWLWDLATRGRPHWATLVGTTVFILQAGTRLAVMMTPQWDAFVRHLPLYGWP